MITIWDFVDNGLLPTYSYMMQSCNAGVFEDPLFWEAPASASHHPEPHQKRNGLALHTFEVTKLVFEWLANEPLLRDLAVTAAIFHDWGKTRQYKFDENGIAVYTEEGKLLNHVASGYARFREFKKDWPEAWALAVEHAILAHHGRKEWGSPVEPGSKIAMLLHAADMVSSHGWL